MTRWLAFTARNNRPHLFHATSEDYIRQGKSLCGIDLTQTGWTTDEHYPASHLKTCHACTKAYVKSMTIALGTPCR